jgi:mRNA interferase MazF
MELKIADVVLCEFYFSDLKTSKNRPVLVLKDNLPFNDFVGLPISSQLDFLREGEVEIDNS